jgi:hypothetical protein
MAHGGRATRRRKSVSVPEGQLGSFIAVDDALVCTTTTVVAAWTQHGRATCGAYGGARLAERRGRRGTTHARVATGDRARMAVRKSGPRRMDQRAQAGLSVRVRRDRDAGDARRRRGRRVPERQCLREFFKQPCLTEQISKKLNRSGPSRE